MSGQVKCPTFIQISELDIANINLDIKKLNESIDHYNKIDPMLPYLLIRNKKISALRFLENELQEIDAKYTDGVILWLVSYQSAIYDKLISAIQKQKAFLHVTCRYKKMSWDSDEKSTNLVELLHTLHAHHLTGILECFRIVRLSVNVTPEVF